MIREKTVFILGAGASAAYRYPTGIQLKKLILGLQEDSATYRILGLFGIDPQSFNAFINAFKKSATGSIDAFLEHRREFLEVGKIVICLVLFQFEDESTLFEDQWYTYIFNNLNTTFESFAENNVSFITFNYDRSLEHFLFTALKNKYNKEDNEIKIALENIPIIHVHGQIGQLEWQDGSHFRPYRKLELDKLQNDPQAQLWVSLSSQGIKIIHENDLDESKEFEQASKLLFSAQRIIFLGFGYHPDNIRRLKIHELDRTKLSQATGSALNMTDIERRKVQSELLHDIFNLELVNTRFHDVQQFIREHVELR